VDLAPLAGFDLVDGPAQPIRVDADLVERADRQLVSVLLRRLVDVLDRRRGAASGRCRQHEHQERNEPP
jgi:hypothetical protein